MSKTSLETVEFMLWAILMSMIASTTTGIEHTVALVLGSISIILAMVYKYIIK